MPTLNFTQNGERDWAIKIEIFEFAHIVTKDWAIRADTTETYPKPGLAVGRINDNKYFCPSKVDVILFLINDLKCTKQ